ncbi:hypothetical protein LEMLEM_LOCUS11987, partial [Lemmus lemmus]
MLLREAEAELFSTKNTMLITKYHQTRLYQHMSRNIAEQNKVQYSMDSSLTTRTLS